MSNSSKADWAKVDAQTDQTINTSEVPPLGSAAPGVFSRSFQRRHQPPQAQGLQPLGLRTDTRRLPRSPHPNRHTGPNWEDRIRAAPRIYAEAHQSGQS